MNGRKKSSDDWLKTLEEARELYKQYLYLGEIRELTVMLKELKEVTGHQPPDSFQVK